VVVVVKTTPNKCLAGRVQGLVVGGGATEETWLARLVKVAAIGWTAKSGSTGLFDRVELKMRLET
jgi:hypothetical protein